jgi:integrase
VVREFLQHRTYANRRDFEAIFHNHVFGQLGDRPIESIGRVELTRLRDAIAIRVGRHAAHAVVKNLNVVGRWYQDERSDRYVWPAIKSPLTDKDRKGRDRVLEDHEIVAIWHACDRQGYPHGRLVQFLLLTTLRRNEAAQLRRSEVVDGIIRLPPERVKTGEPLRPPLPQAARDLLAGCPEGQWYFRNREGQPFNTFTHGKAALDAMLNIEPWILHDLRRTGATLLERAGVLPHVIEATLNHKVRGVAGVYRRHSFVEEKTAALGRLATLLKSIVE